MKFFGRYSTTLNMAKMNKGKASNESTEIWKINPDIENKEEQYHFTNFTIQLNNLPDNLKKLLPQSDSRFRPDLREAEIGNWEKAGTEKHRLEEKQRATRKFRETNPGNDFVAKYFVKVMDPDSGEHYHQYG